MDVVDVSHEPSKVYSGDSVKVHVTLSSSANVKAVYILVYVDGVQKDDYEMDDLGGGEYEVGIGSFDAGSTVEYKIYIQLFDGSTITRDGGEFEVQKSSVKTPETEKGMPGFTWLEAAAAVAVVGMLLLFIRRDRAVK